MRWLPTLAVLLIAWPAGAASTKGMAANAHLRDRTPEQRCAHRIELARHETRCHLHHVGLQPAFLYCARSLKTKQTTANDRAAFRPLGVGHDGIEVFNRAVDEDALFVDSR